MLAVIVGELCHREPSQPVILLVVDVRPGDADVVRGAGVRPEHRGRIPRAGDLPQLRQRVSGVDGDGAAFALPTNVVSAYTFWVRALGKPGGSATMTTCATGSGLDGVLGTADDEIVCSTENVVLLRTSGKQRFVNVTKELTTIALDTDGDGIADLRVPLFDSSLMDYFWNFSNNGLRLAQLRFYPR